MTTVCQEDAENVNFFPISLKKDCVIITALSFATPHFFISFAVT